ncbi:MAG: hypothetical protein DSZ27_07685 [Thiomicrospira sp.]|nr:MAG: hypothetical protein DSZ27_07685 [Thiomicrospira sp.]
MMDSDEPITPKADQRVIDGEVVGESQRKKDAHSAKDQEKPLKAKTDWSGWLPQTFTQKLILLVTILLVSLIAYLGVKSTEQDWQVERINQLQAELVKLKAASKTLKSEQNTLQAELKSLADNPGNQPVISQADVDAVKEDLAALKNTVQTELDDYAEQLQTLAQSTTEKTQTMTETLAPSAETQEKMAKVEQNLKAKLEQMGQQVSELFSFKEAQQERNEWQKQKDTNLSTASISATPLSEMRLKQWIIEINTQWMLVGNVNQTRRQLEALEKAVSMSDYVHKTQLAKRIGQDLSRLETYVSVENAPDRTLIAQLREALQRLPEEKSSGNVSHETSASSPQLDSNASTSGWDRFLDKAEKVFNVRKRESDTDLSDVESMMMHDVLAQRGLLLVDRIQWALDSQSNALLKSSQVALNQFMVKHFPEQAEKIARLLAPLKQLQFKARSPLKIAEVE